ncbi:dienelactone hydrolase family protein [Paenibacillus thailandensis]|uniref:Dienelactone hydrolase family protein n=1 Tax=Paenibacillus thailandensis TaxID=393250 RepID=A0ABW5QW84_9BACL
MLFIPKHSDTAIIVLHEIYGVNRHMQYICKLLSENDVDVYCPDLLERECFDYADESKAYLHFIENVGFEQASLKANRLLSDVREKYKKVYLIGFSVGATVAWLCGKEKLVDGIVGYYGSRIRNYMDISPQCRALLFFPEEEKSFNVNELAAMLVKKPNVEVRQFSGQHGFSDPFSPKYNEQSAEKAFKKVLDFI